MPDQFTDAPLKAADFTDAPIQKSWLDHVGDYFSNALQQVNPLAGGQAVVSAVTHPRDTVKSLGAAQGQLATDAEAAFKKGDYAKGVARVIDYLLPILGPQIAKSQDQAAQGDWASSAGTATGLGLQLAAPQAVKNALTPEAPYGATLTPPTDDQLAATIAPKGGAKVAKMSALAQKVAPALNERGMGASTLDQVDQNVSQGLQDARDALDQAEASIKPTRMAPTTPIVQKLQAARDALNATGIKGGANLPSGHETQAAVLDRAIQDVKNMGSVANFDAWRTMRQSLDSTADAAGAYDPRIPVAPDVKVTGQASAKAAGIIRDGMSQFFPEMASANKDFTVMKNARDVIDAAKLQDFIRANKLPPQVEGAFGDVLQTILAARTLPGKAKLLGSIADALNVGGKTKVLSSLYSAGKAAGISNAMLAPLQNAMGGHEDQP